MNREYHNEYYHNNSAKISKRRKARLRKSLEYRKRQTQKKLEIKKEQQAHKEYLDDLQLRRDREEFYNREEVHKYFGVASNYAHFILEKENFRDVIWILYTIDLIKNYEKHQRA